MFRVETLACLFALAFCGASNVAVAKQLPIASQEEADALAERVDERRCVWAESQWLCYVETAQADDGHQYDSGYYAPGIYVGFQNPAGVPSVPRMRVPGTD